MTTPTPCARCGKKSSLLYRGVRLCSLCSRIGEIVGYDNGYRVSVGRRLSKQLATRKEAEDLLGAVRIGEARV